MTWYLCCWGTRWAPQPVSSTLALQRVEGGRGVSWGQLSPRLLCQVDSAQERVVKREDGEKLAKVSCGWVGSQSAPGAAGPELSPPGCQRLFAGVRAAVHGDQRQDGPQCGLGFHGHSKVSPGSYQEDPQTQRLNPLVGGTGHPIPWSSLPHRELKQRCMKAPSEPRFQLHDYIKREGRGASCCKP